MSTVVAEIATLRDFGLMKLKDSSPPPVTDLWATLQTLFYTFYMKKEINDTFQECVLRKNQTKQIIKRLALFSSLSHFMTF
jgi:hypothetical protein